MKKSMCYLGISCALVIISNLMAGVFIALVFGGEFEISWEEIFIEIITLTIVLYLLGRWVESEN